MGVVALGRGSRAGRASEAYAVFLLEDMGYRVVDVRRKIMVEGVEVGEVDIVAERDGQVYAVEVKAGGLDVSGVRQAYANARLLGARPLVVARGIDEKARTLAGELGVEVILLPDVLMAGFDELRMAVREAVESVIDEMLDFLRHCKTLRGDELEVLEALASSDSFPEAAERLGLGVDELARKVAVLGRAGVLPRGSFRRLRLASKILLACSSHPARRRDE